MSKFESGQMVITKTVDLWCRESPSNLLRVADAIGRHLAGDWGDLDDEDKKTNEEALEYGNRLLSAYVYGETKLWVITESDRSVTTVLFPEDY